MEEVRFVDNTCRDGSNSLWAQRMSTSIMLAIIEDLDAAGFDSISLGRGPGIRAVQAGDEDPSAWLRLGPKRVRNTPLLMHGSFEPKLKQMPRCVSDALIQYVVDSGLKITRDSDPWNNFDRLAVVMRRLEKIGMQMVANLIYQLSPRHDDEYFETKAAEAAATHPYRICFKDVDGVLTPERTRTLVPKILAAVGDIPVEFHNHTTTPLGTACAVAAVQAGIRIIHTGLPPLAEGGSQPSIFTMVKNVQLLGFATSIDLEPLKAASERLYTIARLEGMPIGAPVEYDYSQYLHQTPGGMMSNLEFQLRQLGVADRKPQVLAEMAQVREDLGYPFMITPLSQFVGSQAAVNIVTGTRYGTVTDEVIRYAQGFYGEEAIEVMDPTVRRLVLDRPRAEELANVTPPEDRQTLEDVKARYGGDLTDEEVIFMVDSGVGALPLMRTRRDVQPYELPRNDVARWLGQLPRVKGKGRVIEINRGDTTVKVALRGSEEGARDG